LERFALLLADRVGACRVLLFGSHARGEARPDSDYDLIVISPNFADIEIPRRATGLRQLWYQAGGDGPMDLMCLTPEEFEQARHRISLIAAVLPEALDILPQHC
jgi:predicted nucleotidyltransferase